MELCSDNLDGKSKDILKGCCEGILNMNRLIDALLHFSRMGHVELCREIVDLSSLANDVFTMLRMTDPDRQVALEITEGITARADANLMRIVLENFLGNAWKYTRTREHAVIRFGVSEIDGVPVYFVQDNGVGFKNMDANKLFMVFERLSNAESFEGFGIGLATVGRIIRQHGGRVWAEGEAEKGATFYFTLSAARILQSVTPEGRSVLKAGPAGPAMS